MTAMRCSVCLVLLAISVASRPARADDLQIGGTTLAPASGALAPNTLAPAKPGTPPALVGLDSGTLVLAPPGTAAAARNDGLAGSPQTGIDLSYVPPAERDSYLNSHDFADHLQTSTRAGHHPSALSQMGGVAEGMAINGALMGIEGLTLGVK